MQEYQRNWYWQSMLILLITVYLGSYLCCYKDSNIIINDSGRTPIDLSKIEYENRMQKFCDMLFYPLIKIEHLYRNWQSKEDSKTIWSIKED